jgi:hypothetical protein
MRQRVGITAYLRGIDEPIPFIESFQYDLLTLIPLWQLIDS